MSTPTPAETRRHRADAAAGVRLTLPLTAGPATDVIDLELAHCERLFRTAAYHAHRGGRLPATQPLVARLVPGAVHARHGATYCLASCLVELLGARNRVVTRVEFPRAVFAAFAMVRATYALAAVGTDAPGSTVSYALHATDAADEPFPVTLPRLTPLSIQALAAGATTHGQPDDAWVSTFVNPDVVAGLAELAQTSRVTGLEVAGRIHTRVGFDASRRCFVRILDRLVFTRDVHATSTSVVSTAASWAEFLAAGTPDGPHAPASVHTHVHLQESVTSSSPPPGKAPSAAAEALPANDSPCISIDDIVTHYTAFPDTLSAALIVSVFPDRHVVSLYGYGPAADLRAEPGYRVLATRPIKKETHHATADRGRR